LRTNRESGANGGGEMPLDALASERFIQNRAKKTEVTSLKPKDIYQKRKRTKPHHPAHVTEKGAKAITFKITKGHGLKLGEKREKSETKRTGGRKHQTKDHLSQKAMPTASYMPLKSQ